MKFYEVQPALEAGKKIKRSLWTSDIFLYQSINDICIRISEGNIISWHPTGFDLMSNDWEIIEDIPEVKVEYKPYFRCPSCDCDNTNFAYYKAGWTCKHCGQVVKLIEPQDNKKSFEDILKDHDRFDFWKTETQKILNSDDVWVSWHKYTKEEAKRIVEQTIQDYEKDHL